MGSSRSNGGRPSTAAYSVAPSAHTSADVPTIVRQAAEANAATPPLSADDDAPATTAAEPARSLPPPAPDPDLQACQDAQAFANAAREKDWLGLTEEQIRRLYGWVAAQCKVPTAG